MQFHIEGWVLVAVVVTATVRSVLITAMRLGWRFKFKVKDEGSELSLETDRGK